VQFTYKFSYSKPVELNVVYPQVVHNQLISPQFMVVKPKVEDPLLLPSYKSDYRFSLDHFDYLARIPQRPIGGQAVPDYDEWIPASIVPYTTTFISWMIVFEPKDLHLAFSADDVLATNYLPEVLAYLKRQGNKLLRLGQSPIHFALYRDDQPIADGDLEYVDTPTAFEIRTKTPADLRQRYHLRMSFCTELGKYTEAALMDMHENGWVTLRLFQTVLNRLDVEDAIANHMTEDGKLSIIYIKKFFGFLRDQAVGRPANKPSTSNVNNNRLDDPSWYNDDTSFGRRLDTPYVEILTIIAQNRNKV
jgi:hypothetical protein